MAAPDPFLPSLLLAAAVVGIAGLLAVRQVHESRNRAEKLSLADARHFARQDKRRYWGAGVMVLIATGVIVGSRINTRFAGRPQRLQFAAIWLAVFLLITLLLGLAGTDWLATVAYARRQRRVLAVQRRKALEPFLQKPDEPADGEPL